MQFIYQTLRDNPQVATLLGKKIYPQVAPQTVQAPYCIYQVVSRVPDRCKSETPGDTMRVQVSIYAKTNAEIITITQAVREALDRQVTPAARCDFETSRDLYEAGDLLHHTALDFQLKLNL